MNSKAIVKIGLVCVVFMVVSGQAFPLTSSDLTGEVAESSEDIIAVQDDINSRVKRSPSPQRYGGHGHYGGGHGNYGVGHGNYGGGHYNNRGNYGGGHHNRGNYGGGHHNRGHGHGHRYGRSVEDHVSAGDYF